MKVFLKILIIILFVFFVSEVLLTIFLSKNFRITEQNVILPSNQKYKIKNQCNPALDSEIIHTRNSLGLRGVELDSFHKIKIFTVGGSTTHCMFLNDEQEWTHILYNALQNTDNSIWVNNAGFSGQSTFGHIVLVKDYLIKFKPNYIIFYIGINDMFREQMNKDDRFILLENKKYFMPIYNLKILTLLENLYTTRFLKYSFVNTSECKMIFSVLAEAKILEAKTDSSFVIKYLDGYRKRIEELIVLCKQSNVTPIFLTQASLYTCGYDFSNTINFENKTKDGTGSVCHFYKSLNLYNKALIEVCEAKSVPCIDMANMINKDTTYFYDFVHFTPEGSKEFANVLYTNLKHIIEDNEGDSSN